MKIKVEYSESIQIAEGLWRKISVELEDDQYNNNPERAQNVHNQAKEYVQKWHQEGGVGSGQLPEVKGAPVIQVEKESYDKRVNAILADINNCKTVEELKTYRMIAQSNIYASTQYEHKMEELTGNQ